MKPTAMVALVLLGAATLAVLTRREPVRARPEYAPVTAPGSGIDLDDDTPDSAAPELGGEVRESFDVAQYTYLRLATANGEAWAAVSKTPVSVGQHVQIEGATRMENFTSSTLKRTFPIIYFGKLGDGAAAELPPGHPAIPGGTSPHGAGSATSPASDLPVVQVQRAPGKNGHTIAELYAQRSSLQDQRVRVSGQIIKVTSGVLGKNYVRLRDGSATDAERRELVVTTQADTKPGDVVTLEGTLRLDVDIGIGYKYALLLEDASPLTKL